MTLTVKPLENIGVEVGGFDINKPIDADLQKELVALWNKHGLLLFRDQDITPEKQIAFSRVFGELELHPLKKTQSAAHPELFELISSPNDDKKNVVEYFHGKKFINRLDWHMDLNYTGKPNRGALLRAVICPAEDGRTGFGDLAKAYDALDDSVKQQLQGLEVVYAFYMQRKYWRFVNQEGYEPNPDGPKNPREAGFPAFPEVAYPAALTHPVSGRKVLWIVEQFLDRVVAPHKVGLSPDEALDLLHFLANHIRKPEFHYFHSWKPGDMILWDNWRIMHCTTGTRSGVERVIHRTTIMGDATLGRQLDP